MVEKRGVRTLSRASVRRADIYLYLASAFSLLYVLLSLFWMLFHIGGTQATTHFANISYVICSLIGAVWAFSLVYKSRFGPVRLQPRLERAWILIGIGLICNVLGSLIYGILKQQSLSPLLSVADACFKLIYPFILAGLLSMPSTLRFRMRMALDAIIATLCLLAVSWYFVIGPAYFSRVAHAYTFAKIFKLLFYLSYPCWDSVLIFALMLLIYRHLQPLLHPTLLSFALSITSLTWADSAYAYTSIFNGTYHPGTPTIDTFWFLSSLLLGLAALGQYNMLLQHAYKRQLEGTSSTSVDIPLITPLRVSTPLEKRLQSLLIYVPLALLLSLTVYAEGTHDDATGHYLVILTALVGILVTVRYVLTTHENERLTQDVARDQHESDVLRHLNTQLADILDIETLLQRIVDVTVTQLHFNAAILLLSETWTMGAQSPFRVHASSTHGEMKMWRFQGNNYLSYLLSNKKEVTLHWDVLNGEVPAEIAAWRREEQLLTTYFLPLVYRDHMLGSLGISRRGEHALNTHELEFVQAYTKQIVGIIEHALLYKEARDHEAFARAMANIAARLNAAVVEPTEIYRLICNEGANALQADIAVLYVPNSSDEQDYHGNLVPLASYMTERVSPVNDWPLIYPHDTAAEAFHLLQPTFLHITEGPDSPAPSDVSLRAQNLLRSSIANPPRQLSPHIHEQRRQYEAQQQTQLLQAKLATCHVYTAIVAPLLSGGNSVAMLVLARAIPPGTHDTQSFTPDMLALAQDFAEQAAVAFTNADLYQHLRATHQRLQELDELKDQFMMTASHELRTPLTAVQGYIELLAQFDDIVPAGERREFLRKAQRSCNELVVLLGNVMDASRVETETNIRPELLERVDVRELVESVVTILHPQMQQERRVARVNIPSQLDVRADPVRLRQVVMNLSSNAMKYSPLRTPISYTAKYIEEEHGVAPSVILSVTDQGKGIALKDQQNVFQRFYRLEEEVHSPIRGSGLGLYISRRLIELMGGRIWIESSGIPGEGSTFHVQLPAWL